MCIRDMWICMNPDRQSKEAARSESSVIVCERIARVEIVPAREHLFRESVARNKARLHFWRTDRGDKTKIKINFPYQHTLLNILNDGGLNCASDGIQIHIGGTDSLTSDKFTTEICFFAIFSDRSPKRFTESSIPTKMQPFSQPVLTDQSDLIRVDIWKYGFSL